MAKFLLYITVEKDDLEAATEEACNYVDYGGVPKPEDMKRDGWRISELPEVDPI